MGSHAAGGEWEAGSAGSIAFATTHHQPARGKRDERQAGAQRGPGGGVLSSHSQSPADGRRARVRLAGRPGSQYLCHAATSAAASGTMNLCVASVATPPRQMAGYRPLAHSHTTEATRSHHRDAPAPHPVPETAGPRIPAASAACHLTGRILLSLPPCLRRVPASMGKQGPFLCCVPGSSSLSRRPRRLWPVWLVSKDSSLPPVSPSCAVAAALGQSIPFRLVRVEGKGRKGALMTKLVLARSSPGGAHPCLAWQGTGRPRHLAGQHSRLPMQEPIARARRQSPSILCRPASSSSPSLPPPPCRHAPTSPAAGETRHWVPVPMCQYREGTGPLVWRAALMHRNTEGGSDRLGAGAGAGDCELMADHPAHPGCTRQRRTRLPSRSANLRDHAGVQQRGGWEGTKPAPFHRIHHTVRQAQHAADSTHLDARTGLETGPPVVCGEPQPPCGGEQANKCASLVQRRRDWTAQDGAGVSHATPGWRTDRPSAIRQAG
ncbi:hypothetical protein ACCO45_003747 [Purpureocillium lilacinum]|uniref:Uncharacterized protein n=1 Tax=Purpureocillium lilacinum TaxID=33203 RepID=A0ACC4E0S3_PURLI